MGERRFNRDFIISADKAYKDGASNQFNNITEEFNLNSAYLQLIYFCMSEWELLNLYGIQGNTLNETFYDRQIKILDTMLDLLSAKLTEEQEMEYDTLIRSYETKSHSLFKTMEDNTMMIDKALKPVIDKKIRTLYRFFLRQLQLKGMLTKVNADPRLAMGDMS